MSLPVAEISAATMNGVVPPWSQADAAAFWADYAAEQDKLAPR